jgi:hypothetical protein
MKYTKCMGFATSPSKVSRLIIPSNEDMVLVLLVGDRGVGQNNGNTTDTIYFFMNTVSDHLLLSMMPQTFLKWTCTSFEKPLAEFYTILLEEHLQVALEMLQMGICSSL